MDKLLKCPKCGRYMTRIKEAVGLPLSTGFPPDQPMTASNIPYIPFSCQNHKPFPFAVYLPVDFRR